MAEISTHISGTASINAGEVNVIGQNSTWASSGVQAGDLFWAAGLSVRIASVQDNTHLTLAFPWPGASRAAASYEVKFTPDIVRTSATQRALLDRIAGNLFSIGELGSVANTFAYFIAPGVAALASLTAKAREYLAGGCFKIHGGGTYAPGSIYSDANWGMLYRALQTGANGTHAWARSDGVELARLSESGQRHGLMAGTENVRPVFECVAWVICAADGTIISSRGVSSVSRLSTGRYQVNLVTPMPAGGYATFVTPNAAIDVGCYEIQLTNFKVFTGGAPVDTQFCAGVFV